MAAPVLCSYIDLTNYCIGKKIEADFRLIREDALISRSRCRSMTPVIESKCDVWLQLDHDIQFDAAQMLELCKLAMDKGAAVCVPYPCRSTALKPAYRPKPGHDITIGKDELVPITMFASGCVAIPVQGIRDAIDLLRADKETAKDVPDHLKIYWCEDVSSGGFWSLWQPIINPGPNGLHEYLSEDYSASLRLSAAGMDQLAWTKPILHHWGEQGYCFKKDSVLSISDVVGKP